MATTTKPKPGVLFCADCGYEKRTPEKYIGETVKCPVCSQPTRVSRYTPAPCTGISETPAEASPGNYTSRLLWHVEHSLPTVLIGGACLMLLYGASLLWSGKGQSDTLGLITLVLVPFFWLSGKVALATLGTLAEISLKD